MECGRTLVVRLQAAHRRGNDDGIGRGAILAIELDLLDAGPALLDFFR
jgi:hypothetical protein